MHLTSVTKADFNGSLAYRYSGSKPTGPKPPKRPRPAALKRPEPDEVLDFFAEIVRAQTQYLKRAA